MKPARAPAALFSGEARTPDATARPAPGRQGNGITPHATRAPPPPKGFGRSA